MYRDVQYGVLWGFDSPRACKAARLTGGEHGSVKPPSRQENLQFFELILGRVAKPAVQ